MKGLFLFPHIAVLSALLWLLSTVASPAKADPPPPPTPTYAGVSYGPSPHQMIDVYLPPNGKGPFPVVIWYGAIWQAKMGGAGGLDKLWAANVAGVAVETRVMSDAQADKVAIPVSYVLLDARRALQFVRFHAKDYNIDPNRIATAGGSQGTLPALYVACAGEKADPNSSDPVERMSTKVTCVGAWRSQPSIDPLVMQQWVPGVEWGSPALGGSFADSLKNRDQLLPAIKEWSPDELINKDTPPIYFGNEWPLTKPDNVDEANYRVHSPAWGIGFKSVADKVGATVYNGYPGHPTPPYSDMWDFLIKMLTAPGQ